MSQLEDALQSCDIELLKLDLTKQRPVITSAGTMTVEKFGKKLMEAMGVEALKFPEVFSACRNTKEMSSLLEDLARTKNVLRENIHVATSIPPEMENLTLNMDITADEKPFFLTDERDVVSKISGIAYIRVHQLKETEAVAIARKVWPEYLPRSPVGTTTIKLGGEERTVLNLYRPPIWSGMEKRTLKDELPELFQKLVHHLFPLQIEREYFYSWLYYSLFERSFVYLLLCGNPGTGKNRLKLVMRALHGHSNTIDGKKSSLVERFNSQLEGATLAWFDELHFNMEMENQMKELQNDSISIERKGIDATRSTKIYSSLVISNNRPRDNFISFDARKFAPLAINPNRLETSMTPAEIDLLTKKVENEDSPDFDRLFLGRIARWVKVNGKSKKWPNLEYRGPMFYKLAHTSMSRWQKKAIVVAVEAHASKSSRVVHDAKKGMLWSSLEKLTTRSDRTANLPEYSSVMHLFDTFVDGTGKKSFATTPVPDDIMNDFWVRPIFNKVSIINEKQDTLTSEGKINGKEKIDL